MQRLRTVRSREYECGSKHDAAAGRSRGGVREVDERDEVSESSPAVRPRSLKSMQNCIYSPDTPVNDSS